ncbi:AcrR family transcriptional regulator [Nocardia sp. GAS34]|uniref:TetR/AcrR family transcriptional regulator n=1 Tax=unclassified Nocardia TaxID=2637762 RepID=UPI003D22836B
MVGNRRGGTSRAALLEAGRTAFSSDRYEEVSIVDLARSLGVAAGSISYHFGGKRGFYLAVLELVAEEFWGEMLSMRGPALERLNRGVDRLLDHALAQPGSFEALLADTADAEVRQIRDRHRQRFAEAMVTEVAGTDASAVLRAAVNGWLSFIDGIVVYWLHSRELSREQIRELIVTNFFGTVLGAVRTDPDIELTQRVVDAVLSDPKLLSFIGFHAATGAVESKE